MFNTTFFWVMHHMGASAIKEHFLLGLSSEFSLLSELGPRGLNVVLRRHSNIMEACSRTNSITFVESVLN